MASAQNVIESTFREFQQCRTLKKIPKSKLTIFSTDVSLVALQARTGYLFDAFALQTSTLLRLFSESVSSLRESIPQYRDVFVIHEPIHDQIFFVNVHLLQTRYRVEINHLITTHEPNNTAWMSCILLEPTPALVCADRDCTERGCRLIFWSQLPSIPSSVCRLIKQVCDPIVHNSSIVTPAVMALSAPSDTTTCDLIPFAAFLLEYPIAYIPANPEQSSFLPGVHLDVYECTLVTGVSSDTIPKPHVFMKFSCPSGLSSRNISDELKTRLFPQLEAVGLGSDFQVRRHQETHDRVAL